MLVSRQDDKWTWAIRLGGAGSRWLPVQSRREALCTWASLTAVGQFAESAGIRAFQVETDARSYTSEPWLGASPSFLLRIYVLSDRNLPILLKKSIFSNCQKTDRRKRLFYALLREI